MFSGGRPKGRPPFVSIFIRKHRKPKSFVIIRILAFLLYEDFIVMFSEWDIAFCVFLEKRYNPPAFQQDYRKKAGERILEIGKNLAANRAAMKELFADCGDIVFRDFAAAEGQGQLFLVYVDNMVNTTAVEDAIMTNIMNRCHDTETEERLLGLMESVIANRDVQQVDTIEKPLLGCWQGIQ